MERCDAICPGGGGARVATVAIIIVTEEVINLVIRVVSAPIIA